MGDNVNKDIRRQLFEQVIKQASTEWQAYTVNGPARKLTLERLYAAVKDLGKQGLKRYELSPRSWAYVKEVGWEQAMKDVAEWIRQQEEEISEG